MREQPGYHVYKHRNVVYKKLEAGDEVCATDRLRTTRSASTGKLAVHRVSKSKPYGTFSVRGCNEIGERGGFGTFYDFDEAAKVCREANQQMIRAWITRLYQLVITEGMKPDCGECGKVLNPHRIYVVPSGSSLSLLCSTCSRRKVKERAAEWQKERKSRRNLNLLMAISQGASLEKSLMRTILRNTSSASRSAGHRGRSESSASKQRVGR